MTNENQIIIEFYSQIKNKMKKIIQSCRNNPKSNNKIAIWRKIDTPNTQKHDRLIY